MSKPKNDSSSLPHVFLSMKLHHSTPLITLSMGMLLPFVFDSVHPLLGNGVCSGHAVSLLYSTADSIVFGSADYIGLALCVTVLNGFHFGPCGRVLFVNH